MTDDHWKPALREALAKRDVDALRRVPKTDLHCHGLLSAPIAVYARLLDRPLPPTPRVFGSFAAFIEFIQTHLLPALDGRANVQALIRAALERLPEDGVVYAEMSFDLLVPSFIGISVEQFAAILSEEMERLSDRVTIAPEIGISRKLPAGEIAPLLKEWVATGVFRSLDLYDDESAGNLDDFVPLYRFAEERGLKLKAHAGELCGAERVRESVEKLHLHAVQHGVRAIESPEVTALLAERGTVLHMCPTSNCSLGVCDALENHPARRLFEQGVKLTVNTDDFTLFGASGSEEILNLTRMGFTDAQIEQIVENGLREMPAPRSR